MIIKSIEDIDNIDPKTLSIDYWSNFEGFCITTDEKIFFILVSNTDSCCESWGHITSADNVTDFIGAKINRYRCVDNADYNECELTKKNAGDCVDVYDCAFIDFQTDKGVLQFAVYNNHNGYYGHDIRIIEKAI